MDAKQWPPDQLIALAQRCRRYAVEADKGREPWKAKVLRRVADRYEQDASKMGGNDDSKHLQA